MRCFFLVEPTMGAVTPGLASSQASAHLCGRHVARRRYLTHRVDHVKVGGLRVQVVGEGIRARAGRVALPVARAVSGEHAARERAPWDAPDPLVEAERDHLALFLAVDQVVVVLHGHEFRPALDLGRVLCLSELPRKHAAGSDVASLAGADDVVQRLHRLLNGRAGIPPVDLVQVDVVHLETPQRRVDARQDVLAAETAAVLARRHRHEHLRGDHRLVAGQELRYQPARGDLARTSRIGVRGVEEGDPAFDSRLDDGFGGVLVDHPGTIAVVAEAHHPEADPRDPQARAAQVRVVHG